MDALKLLNMKGHAYGLEMEAQKMIKLLTEEEAQILLNNLLQSYIQEGRTEWNINLLK